MSNENHEKLHDFILTAYFTAAMNERQEFTLTEYREEDNGYFEIWDFDEGIEQNYLICRYDLNEQNKQERFSFRHGSELYIYSGSQHGVRFESALVNSDETSFVIDEDDFLQVFARFLKEDMQV